MPGLPSPLSQPSANGRPPPATATARPGTKVLPTAIKPPGQRQRRRESSEDGDPLGRPGSAPGECRRRPCPHPHPFLGVIPGRWGGRWWPGTPTPAMAAPGQDALLGMVKARGSLGTAVNRGTKGISWNAAAGTGCATFPITCGGIPLQTFQEQNTTQGSVGLGAQTPPEVRAGSGWD